MSRKSRVGLVLLIVGALATMANVAAARVFPDSWGGPNIGGGCLQLLTLGVAGIGVILMSRGVSKGESR
jgi:hypothetical protein